MCRGWKYKVAGNRNTQAKYKHLKIVLMCSTVHHWVYSDLLKFSLLQRCVLQELSIHYDITMCTTGTCISCRCMRKRDLTRKKKKSGILSKLGHKLTLYLQSDHLCSATWTTATVHHEWQVLSAQAINQHVSSYFTPFCVNHSRL